MKMVKLSTIRVKMMNEPQFHFTQINPKFWIAELTRPYSETFDRVMIDHLMREFKLKGIKLIVIRHS